MMKRKFVFLAGMTILLMASFVFAESVAVSEDLNDYVKKVAEKKGVSETDIENVSQVNFSELPKEVNLQDITDADLALYKVEPKTGKPSFVITFSNQGYQKVVQNTYYTTSLLDFGLNRNANGSAFLETPSGVSSGLEGGYVMMREGSITGISTSLNVVNAENQGQVQIVIYKNGEQVGLGNLVEASSLGFEKDYDIQSRNVVTFKPGDVISVYLSMNGNISVEKVVTLVEISSEAN